MLFTLTRGAFACLMFDFYVFTTEPRDQLQQLGQR